MLTFSYQRPSQNYTEQYPKERPKVAERFRGAPRLNNDPVTGETLCIACNLCALACPEHCIEVGWERDRAGQEGVHDVHLRYFAMHVLRSLRRCVPDALPGTDAGLRDESVRPPGYEAGPQKLEEGNQPVVYLKVDLYVCRTGSFLHLSRRSRLFRRSSSSRVKNVVHSAALLWRRRCSPWPESS